MTTPSTEPSLTVGEIRAGVRELLRAAVDVRAILPERGWTPGDVPQAWAELAGLGAVSVRPAERHGGLGLGHEALLAVLEEVGRVLYPSRFRSAVLALEALSLADDPAAHASSAAAVAAGELVVAVALDEPALTWHGDGTCSGTLRAVADGRGAALLVAADTTGTTLLVELARARREPRACTDFSQDFTDLVLDRAPCQVLSVDAALPGRLWNRALLAVAAEQAGTAAECLDRSVGYASIREQFGDLIGRYQAISHRCAEVAVDIQLARGLLRRTGQEADAGDEQALAVLAPLAKAAASDALDHAADALVQIHGGTGFTWEHDAHLFFRRARTSAAWLGSPARLRDLAVERGALDLLAPGGARQG